jgi:hypothetical protein
MSKWSCSTHQRLQYPIYNKVDHELHSVRSDTRYYVKFNIPQKVPFNLCDRILDELIQSLRVDCLKKIG